MATRYEVVDYIKKNRPKFASSFKDDREIYEWARKRYLRNYPSWDEVEARFNIDTTDTATFEQPKNQIQQSDLEQEDYSPEKLNWFEKFFTYGGIAEEALGKGILPEGVNLIKAVSEGLGVSEDYWESAYNNSMAGLMYNTLTGKDKYTVEAYHDGGAKGALIDGSSFLMGMANPVDAMLFAISGGAGKAGTALAEKGIKRAFVKKGMDLNTKALAKNRPFLRSMFSQGVGTSASLGTFFSAQGAAAESARQSKAIKAGEMDAFDTGEIIKKSVEHGKEGLILGGAIGIGIGGAIGTRYGQLMLKSKAEGKNLTRFENVQKALTHPIPRVGYEGALFTLGGKFYRGEEINLGSPEFWNEYIQSTSVIAGLKMSGKLWGKALGKEPTERGEEADRILMEGLKDARSFSEGMEKSLKGVEANVGDLAPNVKDVLNRHIMESELAGRKGMGEGDLNMARGKLNEMIKLFSEFNEKGAEIGVDKMKRLVELSTENENMLRSIVEDMKSDPTKAYEIMGKVKVKKFLSEAEKKQVDNYLENLSSVLEQLQVLRNAPTNGGVHIPKEGINTKLNANEVPLDGVTGTSINKDGTIKIFQSINVEQARKEAASKQQTTVSTETQQGTTGGTTQKFPPSRLKGITHSKFKQTDISGVSGKRKVQLDKISESVDKLEPSGDTNLFESSRDVIAYITRQVLPKRKGGPGGRGKVPLSLERMEAHIKNMGELATYLSGKGKDFYTMDKADLIDFLYNKDSGYANTINLVIEHVGKYNEKVKGLTKADMTAEAGEIKDPVQGARIDYINFNEGTITYVPSKRGGTPAKVPITKEFVNKLKDLIKRNKDEGKEYEWIDIDGESHQFIFWTEQKLPVEITALNTLLSRFSKDVGKQMTQKQFRKAFGSWAQGKNVDKTMLTMIDRIGLAHTSGDLKKVYQKFSKEEFNKYRELQEQFIGEIFDPSSTPPKNTAKDFATTWEIKKVIDNIRNHTGDIKIGGTEGGKVHKLKTISKETAENMIRYQLETNARGVEGLPRSKYLEFIQFERPGVTDTPSRVKPKKTFDNMTDIERLEFSKANLKKQLKQAQIDYNENPSFGAQGIIKDIQSQLKSIGFQLTEARKKKRLAPRKTEEIIFKTQAERDIALQDFMRRNKMTPESLKEAKLGKNEMGEFLDGAIKLAKGEWQPIDFFHENAHRLKYYAQSGNNKKILNMFKQGEKLAEGSKEYKEWLKKNKNVKNPVEEFFTDVVAGEGVAREFNKGFVNKVKQFVNRMVSTFKVAFNKADYKDIARLLSKPVQEGFIGEGGIKTGIKKFRVIPEIGKSTFEQIAPTEYVKAINKSVDKLIKEYNPSVRDKAEIIKIIAEDVGLIDFKLSKKASLEDLGIFYNHLETSIPLRDIPKKVNLASWFRNYRTAENTRLRANVSKEAQKGWLESIGVKEGNIFKATTDQLKSYQAILNTMKFERRSSVDWIDKKLMMDNVPREVRDKFLQYGGLKQSALPVHMVFEGMGLKKLSRKMIDHISAEQGHIGHWIDFENKSINALGNRKWKKYKEHLYLFDRERYVERRDADKLTKAEKNFINKATTASWRNGTDKSVKNMFSSRLEGNFGKIYNEFMGSYEKTFNEIMSKHMNSAEFQKWKEGNHVRWVKGKIYVHRGLTDKFKKLYNPTGHKYTKFVEEQAAKLADKWARDAYGDKYTKEQYSEKYDEASTIAWAELSDMFTYSGERYSSRFLQKRHIKLPEFVNIDGKKVQVYETAYDKTITPYATGMAKLFANLEIFPEFNKISGFKTYDVKDVLGRLEGLDSKHGKWVKEQIHVRLGMGSSPSGDMASTFVKFSQKYATALAKVGLSFPTAGIKNLLVGNTQTLLAFNVSSFTRGLLNTIGRDSRRNVQKTGATELGLRHHEEVRTFKWLDNVAFQFGGMKPTENINRYISVLAGRHDQQRGIEILQRYNPDSKKYKRVANRFKRFYHLSNKEIALIKKYGFNGTAERNFKSTLEKVQISRELDRIYQKMDTLAHINTQGASADVFMPYWWNKGYVKPFTLYKRMAYAATANTASNLKDAWKGRNFMKMTSFMLGSYFTGEALMALQNALIGTPFPTKDDEGMKRLAVILWKAEMFGLGSELIRGTFGSYDQVGWSLYPSIAKNAEDAVNTLFEVKDIWSDMANVDSDVKFDFTVNTLDNWLKSTVSLYGNLKKTVMNKKSKYNTEYKQQQQYFREFAKEMDLSSNVQMDKHTSNYYWDLFENAWNRSYLTGDKESFQKVFWTTFWGIANDYHLRGSNEDGITLRTREDAIKEAAKNIKNKIKNLNPNKYTLTTKSQMGKIKGVKYRLWLGNEKTKQLDGLEKQYWRFYRQWWGKDIADSMSALYLTEMKKYFK